MPIQGFPSSDWIILKILINHVTDEAGIGTTQSLTKFMIASINILLFYINCFFQIPPAPLGR